MSTIDVMDLLFKGDDIDQVLDEALNALEQSKMQLGGQGELVAQNSGVITSVSETEKTELSQRAAATSQQQMAQNSALSRIPSRITSRGKLR